MKLLSSVLMIIFLFATSTLSTHMKNNSKTAAKTVSTTVSKNLKTNKYMCFCYLCWIKSIGNCCKWDCNQLYWAKSKKMEME